MTTPVYYPPAVITPGTTWLQEAKAWLLLHVGLEKDALHIYVALMLVFGSVLLFRWSLRSWKPPALVFAVMMIGEAWDFRDGSLTSVPWQSSLAGSWHDMWNTMFWPLAILALARFTDIFGRGAASPPASDEQEAN